MKDDAAMQAQPPPPPPHDPFAPQPSSPVTSGPSPAVWIGAAVAVIVVLAVGAFYVLGTTNDSTPAADEWVPFTDPATGVTVDLPGEPETTEQSVPVPGTAGATVYLHIVEKRNAAWGLGVYALPNDEFDLDLALQGGVEGMRGTLVSSSPVTFSGYPGVDAEVTFTEDGQDGIGFMRILMLEGEQTAVLLQSLGLASERDMLVETFDQLTASLTP